MQLLPPGEEPSLAENARQEAAATRTVLSGNKVKWVEGDKIRVNGTEYTVSLSDDALSATVEVEEADAYYAFYPSEWVSAYADGVYTFTVPDRQDGFVSDGTTDGASFVNKANPMYAYSTSAHLNMTFHHFFGILQLQLTRTEAAEQVFSRMELKSNNQGTALSGAGFTIAPADGKRIFPSVFSGNAKLRVINLPANVGELTFDAFNGCTALTEVKFESGLYWIGDRAFSGCTSLRSIISYAATPPAMGSDNIFYNLPSDGTLSCPDASAYQDASSPDNKYWYQLKNEKNWTIIQQ